MKKIFTLIIVLIASVFVQDIWANGENNNSKNPTQATVYTPKPLVQQQSLIVAKLIPGSLKSNIERIAGENNWSKVVWQSSDDFTWVTYTKIRKANFKDIMQAILEDFPLQAVFYERNHVLVIQPRTVR